MRPMGATRSTSTRPPAAELAAVELQADGGEVFGDVERERGIHSPSIGARGSKLPEKRSLRSQQTGGALASTSLGGVHDPRPQTDSGRSPFSHVRHVVCFT